MSSDEDSDYEYQHRLYGDTTIQGWHTMSRTRIMANAMEIKTRMNTDHWLQNQISHVIWHRIRNTVDSMNWVETPSEEESKMPQPPIMTERTKYGVSGEREQAP